MNRQELPPIDYTYGALLSKEDLEIARSIFGKARGVNLMEFPETYKLYIKDPLTRSVGQYEMITPEGLVYVEISSKRRRLANLWGHFNHERNGLPTIAEPIKQKRSTSLRATSAVPQPSGA